MIVAGVISTIKKVGNSSGNGFACAAAEEIMAR
jgi:hypothetical protein